MAKIDLKRFFELKEGLKSLLLDGDEPILLIKDQLDQMGLDQPYLHEALFAIAEHVRNGFKGSEELYNRALGTLRNLVDGDSLPFTDFVACASLIDHYQPSFNDPLIRKIYRIN